MLQRLYHFIINTAMVILIVDVCVFGWFGYKNYFTLSTEYRNPRIVMGRYVKPDGVITIEYDIVRHRDCTLDINRIMINEEGREYLVMYETQNVAGDDIVRPSGYSIQVPLTLPVGEYKLFARVRYYCNALDYIIPRFLVTTKVPVTVVN